MTAAASKWQDFVLPVGIVACVLVILVPLPPFLMDLLLAVNITVAVVLLLTTLHIRQPLELSVFPSLLLATTLARLVLNVATTRLILTQADTLELNAAGEVIRAFGQFVAGDRLLVGLIMFVIIVVIQFVVITKGATRISEVAARFALDGMPGRQMAIDADLAAGVIDQFEAQRRRDELARQADFNAAMDGASKFIRGDAVAGLVITLVNLVGGLVIGVLQGGMSLDKAAEVYSLLTIGDGLVSQVPALLISLAAGLLVTRSSQPTDLPRQFLQQLGSRPEALAVAAGFLGMLAFTSLPKLPLLAIGTGCGGLALVLSQQQRRQARQEELRKQAARVKPPREQRVEDYLAVDPLELEIGVGLVRLADPARGGDVLARITSVRQAVAGELGIVLPKVRIRDNMRLDSHAYRIKIGGSVVGEGVVRPGRLLAEGTERVTKHVDGERARGAGIEQPAYWIAPDKRATAERAGYVVQEPTAVLAAHLHRLVRRHADELLSRDAVKQLVEDVRRTSPAAVEELIPDLLKLTEVQQVLRLLLREDVPLRPLGAILEALGEQALQTKDPLSLAEYARQRLGRTLSSRYRDGEQRLRVITLDPELEHQIAAAIVPGPGSLSVCLPPLVRERICRDIAATLAAAAAGSQTTGSQTTGSQAPVMLVSPHVRPAVKQLTVANLPALVVLSYSEVTRDTRVETVGTVGEQVASWN
ncbi:MAG: FHIPEP family type III secretion protein [Pirellulaceae bacterium]|nr:FHIPEP family type III secretion protein [Pirellulaceae bacterium]